MIIFINALDKVKQLHKVEVKKIPCFKEISLKVSILR